MKGSKLLIALILIGILLSGCEKPRYEGDERLSRILYYDAPSIELEGGTMEKLEEDEYGRVLFSFTVEPYNNYFRGICQALGKDTVSFYQDQSLVWHAEGTRGGPVFTDGEITELKKANDWGKPLDPEKMSVVTMDFGHEFTYISNEIADKYELGKTVNAFVAAVDQSTGKQLYYIVAEKDGERSLYFYILEDDFSLKEDTGLEKMEDRLYFQPQLHEFKLKNGWGF